MKKKLLSTFVVGTAVVWGTCAQASVLFDFQNGQGVLNIGSWDWSETSFVAVNGSLAVENFALGNCANNGCDFKLNTHATLTGAKDVNGNQIIIDGLGTDFEITTVFSFTETVVGLAGAPGTGGALATFQTQPNSGEFIEVFYDTNPNAVDLTGHGFNDGRLILAGSLVSNSIGLFLVTDDDPVQLDQFADPADPNSDDYGDGSGVIGQSQLTVTGFGTQQTLEFGSLTQDFAYFKSTFDAFGMSFSNISIGLPFLNANPSDCFTTNTSGVAVGASVASGTGQCANIHVDGLYSAQLADPNGGYLPVVGNINGLGPTFGGGDGGPDFVAQTDFTSAFKTTAVPEPASLALLGIGLVGLGFVRSRKQRTA